MEAAVVVECGADVEALAASKSGAGGGGGGVLGVTTLGGGCRGVVVGRVASCGGCGVGARAKCGGQGMNSEGGGPACGGER